MSKCVIHMQKMKLSAMGGIQSHNQREHESKKNKEIDYSKSEKNYDCVLDGNINYHRAVKGRIDELALKKAVRKDAVVYCSFIVSSDKEFFRFLGEQYHQNREMEKESVAIGLQEPSPFEYMPKGYQEDCIRKASESFFEEATQFFSKRYGQENVINATVHFDEATPHMHLGIVPVTSDGRLSAKEIFTPLELKQLQTEFSEKVGKKFDLERGKEGSQAKHLDEISFKLQKRQEQLDKIDVELCNLELQKADLTKECKDLSERSKTLFKTVNDLKASISTLDTQKRLYEQIIDKLKQAYVYLVSIANKKGISIEQLKEQANNKQAMEYIEQTGQKEKFEAYRSNPNGHVHIRSKDKDER